MKNFLLSLREKWHKDILIQSENYKNDDELVLKQQVDEIKAAISWNNLEVIRLRDGLIRTTPRKIIKLCFDIIEKCNLNCAGCLVFSPLVKQGGGYTMNINQFERDIRRISELFEEEELQVITISGGEPLLHPDIDKFPVIIRKYFSNVNVRIVTNGILLLQQNDSFWENMRDNRVVLEQTMYPIELDFERISQVAKEKGVRHIYMNDTDINEKTMQIFPMSLDSISENAVIEQNERLNFFNCWEANQCIRIQDGRIYTCSRIPHAALLNDFFDLDYKVTQDDSMDIHDAKSKQEIYEFLATAVPFCRYCKSSSIVEGNKWKQSKRELSEWAN